VLLEELVPDPENIAQQPQEHPGVRTALVLEEAVQQGWVLVDLHGIEQVGFAAAKDFVGEFTRFQMQGFPIEPTGDLGWQVVLEKTNSHVPAGKCFLEKLIVRVAYSLGTHGLRGALHSSIGFSVGIFMLYLDGSCTTGRIRRCLG